MSITHIHTYMVRPNKSSDAATGIGGAELSLTGKLFDLLRVVFERSEYECDIEISFNPKSDGSQSNDSRDLMIAYAKQPDIETGRAIAHRLESVTTNRSGLGLLFLIVSVEEGKTRLLVSRFPADNGILAEEGKDELSVEFLERVFMKSAKSYKAVIFKSMAKVPDFWKGHAVDRQINDPSDPISRYWIYEFLDSDFARTGHSGTRRLAIAIREAGKRQLNVEVKQELTAAAILAKGYDGKKTSIEGFADGMLLSNDAKIAIQNELPQLKMYKEKFTFQYSEFSNQIAYRVVSLDNGGTITADVKLFDDVFNIEEAGPEGLMRFQTLGRVVDDRLRKTS